MYYKNFGMLFLIIPLLLNVVGLSGCENQQTKEERLSKETAEEIKNHKKGLEWRYRRDAILLALKYKIDEDKVFDILIKEENLSEIIENFEDFMSSKNLKKRIEHYSEKYNISTDIIASILIDYGTMQSRN
ncbi:MAG: hypothetical protein ABIK26_07755 [Candidatus Omnitrophota bacterium]